MRTRALLFTLAFALCSPAIADAQRKSSPAQQKKLAKQFEAQRKARANKMNGMGANARENMNPALKGLLEGPDSMINAAKKAEGMSEVEREAYAEKWRNKQSKNLGIGGASDKTPVMSLDELGSSGPRARLMLGSEQERRDMLLQELRVHAAYDAKIERVTALAKERPDDKDDLVARAKALRKLEAKRHARAKLRIRAAKVTPDAAKKPGDPNEAPAAKGGE